MSVVNKEREVEYTILKADDGKTPTGEIEALVSVFGNVDRDGERVVPGAFTQSLTKWKASGDPIPIIWAHDWKNPMAYIGGWDASKSREIPPSADHPGGLLLKGTIDINQGNPVADQAFRLMMGRRVREFSFASVVQKEARANDFANELQTVDLVEAGPCLKGVNQETRLVGVKSLLSDDDEDYVEKAKAPPAPPKVSPDKVAAACKSAIGILQGLADSGTTDGKKVVAACQAAIKVIGAMSKENNPKPSVPWAKSAGGIVFRHKAERRLRAKAAGWDGNAAMKKAVNAPDPKSAFAAICAGRSVDGEPENRTGWSGPHHDSPGAPPNKVAVKMALGMLKTTHYKNPAVAKAHLEGHLRELEKSVDVQMKAAQDAILRATFEGVV